MKKYLISILITGTTLLAYSQLVMSNFEVDKYINLMKSKSTQCGKHQIKIKNKSGKTVYLYKSQLEQVGVISNDSTIQVHCAYDYAYKFNPDSERSALICYRANTACGKTIFIE